MREGKSCYWPSQPAFESLERRLLLSGEPSFAWSTYLGGTGIDHGHAIAADADGNAIVTGSTYSTNLPGKKNTYNAGGDAFIAKVDSTGAVIWSAYFGGSGWDCGYGVTVDHDGNILVTGETSSTDLPLHGSTASGGGNNAFVAKFTAGGDLIWSTYVGGGFWDGGYGIAVDSGNNAVIAGRTQSADMPSAKNSHHGGTDDAFVAKVSSQGHLQWTRYVGGTNHDTGRGVAVDSADNALVIGDTYSTDLEGRNNASFGDDDAFLAQVTTSGDLAWSTYVGGSGWDCGYGVAVDGSNNAVVVGGTYSSNLFGKTNSLHSGGDDGFVAKVDSSGGTLWSTYLGGTNNDHAYAVAIDRSGNALVTGDTYSTDLDGHNNAFTAGGDSFLAKVSDAGNVTWSTYLGGTSSDMGLGVAVDRRNNVLIMGDTSSNNLPGHGNAYSGSGDVFAARFTTPSRAGDTNWDGKIDGIDLATLARNWNPLALDKTWEQGDFNGDGRIDGIDLAALAQNWSPLGYSSESAAQETSSPQSGDSSPAGVTTLSAPSGRVVLLTAVVLKSDNELADATSADSSPATIQPAGVADEGFSSLESAPPSMSADDEASDTTGTAAPIQPAAPGGSTSAEDGMVDVLALTELNPILDAL